MNFKKLLQKLTGRKFLTLFLIGAQMLWIALALSQAVEYARWIAPYFQLFSIAMALYIINKAGVPAYRLGWIIVIMVTPVFGGILYLLIGEKRPASKMRRQLTRQQSAHDELLRQDGQVARELKERAPRASATFKYLSERGRFPFWKNTRVKYHSSGEDQYSDMLAELKKAERFIFLEYFIIEQGQMWDEVLSILVAKVRQGLDVRVIYDDIGCVSRIPSNYHARLESMGIKSFVFNRFVPFVSAVMNHRDHRKMMVIDGHTAFTGGMNMADEYINRVELFGHWKDTGIMLKGDAAWSFTVMFLEMWNAFRPTDGNLLDFRPPEGETERVDSDGFVQPFADSPLDEETVSVNVYLDILSQARDYVYIFSPYLAISDELQLALMLAAKRGVDVRLALPGIPDKKIAFRLTRSYYGPLRKAGIKIYEYTPGFLHGKSYVCDDEIAVVGTINMDYRSLYLHFECGVLMYGCSAIADIKADALRVFETSREVERRYRDRGALINYLGVFFDLILRVFAPLF